MPSHTYQRDPATNYPIIDVELSYSNDLGILHPSGTKPSLPAKALIDTGATHVIVPNRLVTALGLAHAAPINNTVVGGIVHAVQGYAVDILFGPLPPNHIVTGLLAVEQDCPPGYDILIGWDAMRFFDWTFDRRGAFTLSW